MWAYPWLAARFGARRLLIGGAGMLALRAIALSLLGNPVAAAPGVRARDDPVLLTRCRVSDESLHQDLPR
jgi:hypothetical protein